MIPVPARVLVDRVEGEMRVPLRFKSPSMVRAVPTLSPWSILVGIMISRVLPAMEVPRMEGVVGGDWKVGEDGDGDKAIGVLEVVCVDDEIDSTVSSVLYSPTTLSMYVTPKTTPVKLTTTVKIVAKIIPMKPDYRMVREGVKGR